MHICATLQTAIFDVKIKNVNYFYHKISQSPQEHWWRTFELGRQGEVLHAKAWHVESVFPHAFP